MLGGVAAPHQLGLQGWGERPAQGRGQAHSFPKATESQAVTREILCPGASPGCHVELVGERGRGAQSPLRSGRHRHTCCGRQVEGQAQGRLRPGELRAAGPQLGADIGSRTACQAHATCHPLRRPGQTPASTAERLCRAQGRGRSC